MRTDRSTINYAKIKTKQKEQYSNRNVLIKLTLTNNLLKDVLNFNNMKIITPELKKKNSKLKRLVKLSNNKQGETNIIDLPK